LARADALAGSAREGRFRASSRAPPERNRCGARDEQQHGDEPGDREARAGEQQRHRGRDSQPDVDARESAPAARLAAASAQHGDVGRRPRRGL
jgi:hypothetical protein